MRTRLSAIAAVLMAISILLRCTPASAAQPPRPHPPQVVVHVPATANGTVAVDVAATDRGGGGIAALRLYLDGVLVGSYSTATATYAWDSTAVTNGAYTFRAVAMDQAGRVGRSGRVTVTVANSTNPGFAEGTPEVLVTELYREVLGRSPDPEGFRYWVEWLKRGGSYEYLRWQFLNYKEYVRLQQAPPSSRQAPPPSGQASPSSEQAPPPSAQALPSSGQAPPPGNTPPPPGETPLSPPPPVPPPASVRPLPTVGPEEKILTNGQLSRAGLLGWPDGTMGVRKSSGTYTFLAASGGGQTCSMWGLPDQTVGTLENPIASATRTCIPVHNMKNSYDYVGGGPVYTDPATGTLLMLYHAETSIGGDNFWTTLGMAKSTDGANSWTDLGPIITAHYPLVFDPNRLTTDLGGGTYLVTPDGYFHVFFRDRLADAREIFVAAARARVVDVVDAAVNRNDVVPWMKYYNGTWSEPGIGGRSSDVEASAQHVSWRSVAWNSVINKWIMIASARTPDDSRTALTWFESTDGLNWTGRRQLETDQLGGVGYPTIIGLGDDPSVTDSPFYVYYASIPPGGSLGYHSDLSRRSISLE